MDDETEAIIGMMMLRCSEVLVEHKSSVVSDSIRQCEGRHNVVAMECCEEGSMEAIIGMVKLRYSEAFAAARSTAISDSILQYGADGHRIVTMECSEKDVKEDRVGSPIESSDSGDTTEEEDTSLTGSSVSSLVLLTYISTKSNRYTSLFLVHQPQFRFHLPFRSSKCHRIYPVS